MKFKVKKDIFRILPILTPFVNFSYLIKRKSNPVFLPFYHCVSDSAADYIEALYPVKSVDDFKAELEFIIEKFTPVDLSELIDLKDKRSNFKNGKPIVHFSFDDGLMSCKEVIAPILIKKGIPATFFVTKNFIEGQEEFYRFGIGKILVFLDKQNNYEFHRKTKRLLQEAGCYNNSINASLLALNQKNERLLAELYGICGIESVKSKDFMDKDEIRILKNMGFSIGAHSISHPLFSTVDEEKMVDEVTASVNYVRECFAPKNNVFAFPFSDDGVTEKVFKRILDVKDPQLDLTFGTAGLKYSKHKNHLQRVPMELYSTDPLNRIRNEYLYFRLQSVLLGHRQTFQNK